MNTQILDITIKDLFGYTKKYKIEAIEMLIDSIADDKSYETQASIETDAEALKYKI